MPTEIKRINLIAAAKELNELLDADPKIRTVAMKSEDMIPAIKKAGELLENGDKLTTGTKEVLEGLGVELPEGIIIDDDGGPADALDSDEIAEPAVEVTETTTGTTEDDEDTDIYDTELVSLIGEMNDIMALDPAIVIPDGSTTAGLKALVMENCYNKGECEIYDTDKFSQEAWKTLKKLKVNPVSAGGDAKKPEEKNPATKGKAADKNSSTSTKTTAGKKETKQSTKPVAGKKPSTPAAPAKKTPEKTTKQAPPAKKESEAYTRSHALIDALKAGPNTREEIVALSDKLFVKKGGTTNSNVANYMFGYVMPSLKIIGSVKQEGKIFTWNE